MADRKGWRALGKLKIIGVVVGVLAAIYAIAILAVAGKSAWDNYQQKKAAAAWQAELEKPYREDTLGGQTPEETWNMFLDALRKGDIELASKYFAVDKQDEYRQDLEQAKQDKKIEQRIKYMEGLKKDPQPNLSKDKFYYYYNYYNDEYKRILSESVIFGINHFTNVWKILVL